MTGSISALRSSFSFLSFSSKIYRRPNDLIFPRSKALSISLAPKPASLAISASVASPPPLETMDLKKLVISRLPGGFAAQPIIRTFRPKCAIARVDLQESTRKVVPNYGDAKVFVVVSDSLGELRMSGPECCSNPPTLNPSSGAGHVEKLGGLNTYVAGPADSNRVVILISDVFGYEAPNLRKLADKVAAAGFYVVVPDFFYGDPYDQYNPERPVQVWVKDHGTDKGLEDAKLVIEALKSKGVSAIGAAGFCWGAKVVVELAKPQFIQAALMLHPSMVTVDDIKGVEVPIAILGAEIDKFAPPALLKQFEEVLAAKNEVESYVKIFPKVSHGWSVRYSLDDPAVVSAAEEAHQNLLEWFSKYVK